MAEASAVGLFRTLIFIIGLLVVIRFIGRLMVAKRNLSAEAEMKRNEARRQAEKEAAERNYGKTRILNKKGKSSGNPNVEDVDYTEL